MGPLTCDSLKYGSFTLRGRNWKGRFHSGNASNVFLQTTPVILDLSKKKHLGREITWLSWRHRFQKAPFFKMFSLHTWTQSRRFRFLLFEERFRKALFLWWISVDGRTNRRNKAAFLNSSGKVRTRPMLSFFKVYLFLLLDFGFCRYYRRWGCYNIRRFLHTKKASWENNSKINQKHTTSLLI